MHTFKMGNGTTAGRLSSNLSCLKVAVAPGCTFAHVWRVTLELVESCLVTLWWATMFNPLPTFKIQWCNLICNYVVISGESRLDASSLKGWKLKWECYYDVNYLRWSFNYVIVRQALKWFIARSWWPIAITILLCSWKSLTWAKQLCSPK